MAGDASSQPAARRVWVVLLYFYLAALIGLGFVITGTTTALFGVKDALLPGLALAESQYDYDLRYDPFTGEPREPTDAELAAARQRAIDSTRASGVDSLVNGLIITGVGVPVLIWHYRRARKLNAAPARAADRTADGAHDSD